MVKKWAKDTTKKELPDVEVVEKPAKKKAPAAPPRLSGPDRQREISAGSTRG